MVSKQKINERLDLIMKYANEIIEFNKERKRDREHIFNMAYSIWIESDILKDELR